MTLDEAIIHCDEIAEEQENACEYYEIAGVNANHKCASEHRQLSAWLRELQIYRQILPSVHNYLSASEMFNPQGAD